MVKDKSELDIDLNRVVSDPDYRRKVLQRLNAQRRAAQYRPEWPNPSDQPNNGIRSNNGAKDAAQDPTPSPAPSDRTAKRKSE